MSALRHSTNASLRGLRLLACARRFPSFPLFAATAIANNRNKTRPDPGRGLTTGEIWTDRDSGLDGVLTEYCVRSDRSHVNEKRNLRYE